MPTPAVKRGFEPRAFVSVREVDSGPWMASGPSGARFLVLSVTATSAIRPAVWNWHAPHRRGRGPPHGRFSVAVVLVVLAQVLALIEHVAAFPIIAIRIAALGKPRLKVGITVQMVEQRNQPLDFGFDLGAAVRVRQVGEPYRPWTRR